MPPCSAELDASCYVAREDDDGVVYYSIRVPPTGHARAEACVCMCMDARYWQQQLAASGVLSTADHHTFLKGLLALVV